ncbi:MAG TPA: hypothetical protein VJ821_06860 [Anaerolineales bacterium]|nr:hypothetical protein [Anaerolineales bacterium]
MNEQENFFSPNHKRLLNIATSAKYLAWIVPVIYLIYAIAIYIEQRTIYLYYGGSSPFSIPDFTDFLIRIPSFGLSILAEMFGVFLKGIIYSVVLKGVSLGLTMIVETDINHRTEKGNVQ